MDANKGHRLSDGTTIKVRTERTIAGTYFTEVPSRKRKGATFMLLDHHMFLMFGKHIVPITNDAYRYAENDKAGAALALAFGVDSAEAVIAEAAKDGLPVEDYYAKDES